LEGSDLRRCLPEPSIAVFVLTKTMMGQADATHTLLKASRMERYIVPMLLAGGRRTPKYALRIAVSHIPS
jgi:hypothetical protein